VFTKTKPSQAGYGLISIGMIGCAKGARLGIRVEADGDSNREHPGDSG
jgi:hypothetical protein